MSVQNLEISKTNLLTVVVNLPESEFERLIASAKKCVKHQAEREINLIKRLMTQCFRMMSLSGFTDKSKIIERTR